MSIFLAVLLLSNSSLALEILTHDAHQHAAVEVGQVDVHAMHGMSETEGLAQVAEAEVHGGDDCICDDICCLTSIDLGLAVADNHPPLANESFLAKSNFYRSIALDLFLPPPTP